MIAFESFGIVSYLHSRVIMAKSCICEIKRDIGRKSRFSYTHCIRRPRYGGGGPRRNITITFGTEKLEWCGYPTVKKMMICLAVLTQYRRVTDGRAI